MKKQLKTVTGSKRRWIKLFCRCRSHFCRGHRRDIKYNDLCGISSWYRCWWTHGLTSVVVAALFALSSFFSPLISIVPTQATAPALILVGVMMMASFADIKWPDMEEAVTSLLRVDLYGLVLQYF